jgi:hypothetical protein
LIQQRHLGDSDGDASEDNMDDPVKISVSNQPPSRAPNTEDTKMAEGVALALQSPSQANHNNNNQGEDMLLLKPPTPHEDIVHKCRAVADWLTLKTLQSGFVSHTDGGLLAASTPFAFPIDPLCVLLIMLGWTDRL